MGKDILLSCLLCSRQDSRHSSKLKKLYLLDKLHNENMKTKPETRNMKTRELNWDRDQGKHTGRGTTGWGTGGNMAGTNQM